MKNKAGINVDLSYAETCIQLMKQMQTGWKCRKLDVPDVKGSGKLVSELQSMVKAYSNLHTSFMEMLDHTITFMDGVKDDFIKNDEALAKTM